MKTSSLAMAAFLVLGSLAAPVMAAENDPAFHAGWYVNQLQQKGINAIDAREGWNGKFIATVVTADGTRALQYFDNDTLQPVNAAGGNTRVLSKLDTGANSPRLPLVGESLMAPDTDHSN